MISLGVLYSRIFGVITPRVNLLEILGAGRRYIKEFLLGITIGVFTVEVVRIWKFIISLLSWKAERTRPRIL
jgi:hypothetical protein